MGARHAVLSLVAILGAATAAAAMPASDATRHARQIDNALLFVPEPAQVRGASAGFHEALADLIWVRTVIVFGERYGAEMGPEWSLWLRRMIQAIYTLDPTWRTVYSYGSAMLRVCDDIDGADEVLRAATEALPDESFFPFSLGMNEYLFRDDPAAAAVWVAAAARRPDAPAWYAAAAAAMHQRSGDRLAGIRYLEELRTTMDNPAIIADTDRQLARLRHNALVDTWAEACIRRRDAHGPLRSPEELEQLGFALPENPRGDRWIVASDGVVRSEGADGERLRRLRTEEWQFLAR